MEEIWKDIPDYEGIYQASNLGRIRTAPNKTTYTELRGVRHWKMRIMKGKGNNKHTCSNTRYRNHRRFCFLWSDTDWQNDYKQMERISTQSRRQFFLCDTKRGRKYLQSNDFEL